MAKFVLAYQGGGVPESPEEGEAVMAAWMSWYGELGASVIDGGNPFAASRRVASDGSVSDGGSAALTGYTIIDAADLDAAASKATGCPILSSGGSVDVYATLDM